MNIYYIHIYIYIYIYVYIYYICIIYRVGSEWKLNSWHDSSVG